MKVVIPAKTNSTRIPEKNWREFVDGKSLLDILIDKMHDFGDIYVSCEDATRRGVVEARGANFLLRDQQLTHNNAPLGLVWNSIVSMVPGDDDIFWVQCINPFFDEHASMYELWQAHSHNHDSMVAIHPFKDYVLDQNFNPIGFGFGPFHTPSQQLPSLYHLTFCAQIIKRETLRTSQYFFGPNAFHYQAQGRVCDIDNLDEFEDAALYAKYHKEG
jgi:CMP-N-acetylneuraminic acid synthetase